jgi:hypothetical protein
MPLDVVVEALVGFALGIIGTVVGYLAGLKDISVRAQFAGKTFEQTNSRRGFRNVQKTRTFVFNSFLTQSASKGLPSVEEALKINPALKAYV